MGYFLALMAIFFWSFNLIIASYFATSLTPWELATGRWVIAALILIPLAWKGLVENYKWLLENWFFIFALALSGIIFDNTLIYFAGHTASVVDMGVLGVTGPIFLVILSRIFIKTPISWKQVVGLLVSVYGVLIIIAQGDLTQLRNFKFVSGDFWMLLNTFFFAVYSMLQAKRPAHVSQLTLLGATVIVGILILFPLMWLETGAKQLSQFHGKDWIVIIYLGIFNSVVSYLAWNTALAKIGPVKTGIIYYILPVFSGIEAYFILGEKIIEAQVLGGLLVIAGIVFVGLRKKAGIAAKNERA